MPNTKRNKKEQNVIKILKDVKNLNQEQKTRLIPQLCDSAFACLCECVHIVLYNRNIPQQKRKYLAKRLRGKKDLLRTLADDNIDLASKRAFAQLTNHQWNLILTTILSILKCRCKKPREKKKHVSV